jgi:hypothetical protein
MACPPGASAPRGPAGRRDRPATGLGTARPSMAGAAAGRVTPGADEDHLHGPGAEDAVPQAGDGGRADGDGLPVAGDGDRRERGADGELGQGRQPGALGAGPAALAGAARWRLPSCCRIRFSQGRAPSRRGTSLRPRPSSRGGGTAGHRSRPQPADWPGSAALSPAWSPPGSGHRASSGPGRRTSVPGRGSRSGPGLPRPASRPPSAGPPARRTRRPGRRRCGTTGR